MKKTTQILWGVLCAGVLLMGAGTGMAFATYASFDYDQETLKPKVVVNKVENVIKVPADTSIEVWNCGYGQLDVVYDKAVPVDEVHLETTYNSSHVELCVSDETDGDTTHIEVISSYLKDEFELAMENKDAILEGLKNDTMMTYDTYDVYCVDVEVRVNPANKDRIVV